MRIQTNQSVCERKGEKPQSPRPLSKVGIALSTLGKQPINGLRHKPTDTTNGWYLWCGHEFSEDPDFFSPLHVEHLSDKLPEVLDYLELPPGYRFLIDRKNYEDVWFDPSLLEA
ncbi:immunity protein Imm33 domain-containing protein [Uliginosibacterium sediminicola]|uniref:Imm33-like domain-containing protein n=1 Tax=Uliginosibacterium sediminicola TaxID=2024550 RepID=A0ABU9YYI9_9RHOO